MDIDPFTLLVIALATWRLAFALALETLPFALGVKWREWLRQRARKDENGYPVVGSWYDLFTCPLCLSFWLVWVVLGLYVIAPLVVFGLAVAGGALWLHRSGR